jgi:hypothetical protein
MQWLGEVKGPNYASGAIWHLRCHMAPGVYGRIYIFWFARPSRCGFLELLGSSFLSGVHELHDSNHVLWGHFLQLATHTEVGEICQGVVDLPGCALNLCTGGLTFRTRRPEPQ